MEIGAAAISFLIDTWEGHLTPPEAASIADRASRGCCPNMVRAAAELALSCLPHAHALNPNEITRAILQCKEQSDIMLEHACLTVENAAKGGGVYPEVLFQVAKYWYELYVRHTPGGEQLIENDLPHDPLLDAHGALVALIEPNADIQIPPGLSGQNGTPVITNSGPVVVTTAPPPPYQHPAVTTLAPLGMSMPYAVGPYSFTVQGLHPHHVSYGGPIHPHAVQLHQPPPPHVQMYLSPPQFQYPPHTTNQQSYANIPPPAQTQYQMPAPAPTNYPPPNMQPNPGPQMQYYGAAVTIAQSANIRSAPVPAPGHVYPLSLAASNASGMVQAPPPQTTTRQSHRPQQFTQIQLRYLLAAYGAGMLAMETLARRVHDDRPQAKYARNPPYGEDVKWLLRISKHLGNYNYYHRFFIHFFLDTFITQEPNTSISFVSVRSIRSSVRSSCTTSR